MVKLTLTAREQRFVGEYLIDLNPERAAIAAGYSKTVARSKAYQWVSNSKQKPRVFEAIERARERIAQKLEIRAEEVLQEIARLAFSNMGDYIVVQKDGSFYVDFSKLTSAQMAAVQECTVDEWVEGRGEDARQVRRTKFKLADKGINLERLGKHLKLFTEKHEHGFTDRQKQLAEMDKEELYRLGAEVNRELAEALNSRAD